MGAARRPDNHARRGQGWGCSQEVPEEQVLRVRLERPLGDRVVVDDDEGAVIPVVPDAAA